MYELDYSGRTSHVSSYVYCRDRSEGLVCDAKCALLAIAEFLVFLTVGIGNTVNFI